MKRFVIAACLLILVASASFAEGEKGRSLLLPIGLNVLPGLGVGSFAQGDIAGGLIGLGGEAAGFVAWAVGIGRGLGGYDGTSLYLAGAALWAGTKIFEILRPIGYARRAAEKTAAIGVAPVLTVADGGLEAGLALRLGY